MTVSIIIPTYNGRQKVVKIIKALEQQSFRQFETIVVIDGSTDDTANELRNLQTTLDLKIIEQENGGRSKVRNNGVRHSRGELLLFFDDDMLPLPDCVSEHIQHHQRYPGSIMTGAAIENNINARNDFQIYKATLSVKWAEPLINLEGKSMGPSNVYLTAANFSISKKLFLQLGGFDEQLGDAEDFDLGMRATKAGIPLYYNHKAFAWHDDRVTVRSYIRRLRQYQHAHENLHHLKPELYKEINLRKPVRLKGVKRIFFSLFLHPVLLDIIDKQPRGLKLLPKKLRYKLYDITTSAYGVFFTHIPVE